MLKIQRLNSLSKLGAVVSNINISDKLSDADLQSIKKLWNEVYVLVFPNQILDHSQFENFSLIFGEFGEDPFLKSIKGHPNIIEVKRAAMEKASHFGASWHSDWSFQKTPPSATLLYSKIIPPEGGDTLFANTISAYEDLPYNTKMEIENLKVIHSAALPYAEDGFYALEKDKDRSMKINPSNEANKTFSHPLVRTHPETKKKGLFINPVYSIAIDGIEKVDSDKLLNELYLHMTQDKYIYRHIWKRHMLVIWDNRAVMHQATGNYDGYDRLLHRITIQGERPL